MLRTPDLTTLRANADGVVYFISERTGVISADLIAAMPDLELILRLGSLTYDIDLDAAQRAGVIVAARSSPGEIRVAEHVMMLTLSLAKRLNTVSAITRDPSPDRRESRRTDENTFAYNWSNQRDINQLYERTVGILGFGEIGVELARRLSGWGCAILYHKRRRLPESVERDLRVTYADRQELLASCDYLVNLLPYFPETDQSINAKTFAAMKSGACFISAGSGSVIDESALVEALQSGRLSGAALDTFEWEPLKLNNPLVGLARSDANIILTPHTAAGSVSGAAADRERATEYEPIRQHLRGESIAGRIV